MTLTRDQRINRLKKRLVELHLWTVRSTLPLDRWTFNRAPHASGAPWPTREGVAAFGHPEVSVPADWPLERTRLDLDLGGEGLVRLDYGDGKQRSLRPRSQSSQVPPEGAALLGQSRNGRPPALRRTQPRAASGNRARHPVRARASGICPARPAARSTRREVLGAHEVIEPLIEAGERALARVDWPTETSAYVARVAPGHEAQLIWELPRGPRRRAPRPRPGGARYGHRRGRGAERRPPHAPRPLSADRIAGADRSRPYRPRLAVAARRDAAQGGAHLPHRDRPDGPLSGLPLQPVDRAALRLSRRGRSGAARPHQAERSPAGQWEPIGGMWVEPDTNMPTGESFVPPAALRPALFRQDVRPPPHGLLAARLLRLLAGLAAAPAARRHRQLLHHQGELVRDQQDALRPLLVGGPRRQPRARAHLRQSGRRLQRPRSVRAPSSRPGGTIAASTTTPKACLPSAMATAAAARPRRCSSASASSPISRWCRRFARSTSPTGSRRPRQGAGRSRSAGLGRRDLSRAPPRHADDAGPHQISSPARRARADHRRDAVEHGDAARRSDRAVARGALARGAPQPVPRHPARLEHPRGLRGGRSRARRASSPRARRSRTNSSTRSPGSSPGPAAGRPCSSSIPICRRDRCALVSPASISRAGKRSRAAA